MERALRLSRALDRASDAIGHSVSWCAVAMVAIGAFNALARWIGRDLGRNIGSTALMEAQWYLFSALFLLGASWTLRQDAHVRVDVLSSSLSPRARAWIDLAGTVLLLLPTCAFVLWASWPTVVASFAVRETSPDPGGLPRWPIKAVVLVGFALLGAQGVSEAIKRAARLAGSEPPPEGLAEDRRADDRRELEGAA